MNLIHKQMLIDGEVINKNISEKELSDRIDKINQNKHELEKLTSIYIGNKYVNVKNNKKYKIIALILYEYNIYVSMEDEDCIKSYSNIFDFYKNII